jgi:hypothetical protein
MTLKTLATAACIALSSATASYAVPINLDFTLGDASGTFYGLDDDKGINQSATSFDFITPSSFWTAVRISDLYFEFDFNQFDFSPSGELVFVWAKFRGSLLSYPSAPFDVIESFDLYGGLGFNVQTRLEVFESDVRWAWSAFSITPISPVPLPAGGLLLLSGLAGVAALKRRKKRTA